MKVFQQKSNANNTFLRFFQFQTETLSYCFVLFVPSFDTTSSIVMKETVLSISLVNLSTGSSALFTERNEHHVCRSVICVCALHMYGGVKYSDEATRLVQPNELVLFHHMMMHCTLNENRLNGFATSFWTFLLTRNHQPKCYISFQHTNAVFKARFFFFLFRFIYLDRIFLNEMNNDGE